MPGTDLRTEDPPYGAAINYWLGETPDGEVTLEIVDADGNLVRTLRDSGDPGINRVWWDLRHEPREDPVLRTDPPGKEWVEVPEEGRSPITWGSGFVAGPKAVPGNFTVRLTVDGQEQTRQLTVLKDPYSAGTLADIRAQVDLSLRMRDEINRLVGAVNKLEWVRRQLDDVEGSLEGTPQGDAVSSRVAVMREQAIDIEHRFIDVYLTGRSEDSFRNPMKLYGRYIALMRELDSTADYLPTDQQQEVARTLQERLQEALRALGQFMETELTSFNEFLQQQQIPTIIS